MMRKTSVLIIGAGPAGLTTALQLKRFGIHFLLFEGGQVGGLLHNANWVENYPGFPQGVRGEKLVKLFEKQAGQIGVDVLAEEVVSLKYENKLFVAKTTENKADLTGFQNLSGLNQNEYYAEIAVIASGTKPRQFAEVLIAEGAKERVFYEIKNLAGVEGEEIVIVGAGDAAFDYALNLAGRGNGVTVLNRGKEIKALGLLVERAHANVNIRYVDETRLVSATSAGGRGLMVEVARRNDVEIREASFLLGALGRVPNLDFLDETIESREDDLMERGVLHFAGDVRNGIFRQTVIAAGDGLRTAMKIDQFFKEKV